MLRGMRGSARPSGAPPLAQARTSPKTAGGGWDAERSRLGDMDRAGVRRGPLPRPLPAQTTRGEGRIRSRSRGIGSRHPSPAQFVGEGRGGGRPRTQTEAHRSAPPSRHPHLPPELGGGREVTSGRGAPRGRRPHSVERPDPSPDPHPQPPIPPNKIAARAGGEQWGGWISRRVRGRCRGSRRRSADACRGSRSGGSARRAPRPRPRCRPWRSAPRGSREARR
jgi:hypothetical protein